MADLVIVESPAKADTIEDYLPTGYSVEASYGHIRDLPKNQSEIPDQYKDEDWATLGVDTETFDPVYVVKKEERIRELRDKLERADHLYLATDEDREGEAISWHLLEVLEPSVDYSRITFNEITKKALHDALNDPREVDLDLVRAQEARRILDRLVGYPLSDFLGEKIKWGLSAGRVQSVVTRFLVDREIDRYTFESSEYWDLEATFLTTGSESFDGTLKEIDGKPLASPKDFDRDTGDLKDPSSVVLLPADRARKIAQRLSGRDFEVRDVSVRSYTTSPAPPFTTSTLQKKASSKLGMNSSYTMNVAQSLYEDGHITYMRTDSPALSDEAIDGAREQIRTRFTGKHLPNKPNFYSSSGSAEEAHEAIRPAGKKIKHVSEKNLTGKQASLYNLIWERTVASQMKDAEKTGIDVEIVVDFGGYELLFKASDNKIDFPGFINAYTDGNPNPTSPLLNLSSGQTVVADEIEGKEHHTRPPNRYSESKLIDRMKKSGIGRPSTYSSTISRIKDKYAWENRGTLRPTFMAIAVVELLEEHFPEMISSDFTAEMEDSLDEIASGQLEYDAYLKDFFRDAYGFDGKLEDAMSSVSKEDSRRIESIPDLPDWLELKVGYYGAYAEVEMDDGQTETVDLPDEVSLADLEIDRLKEKAEKEREQRERGGIGEDPETGKEIFVREGQYGFYLQKGEEGETTSIPDQIDPNDVDEDYALRLFDLPRSLGDHPDRGGEIEAGIGSYGPYLRWEGMYVNLDRVEEVWSTSLSHAVDLIEQTVLQVFDDRLRVIDGKYGPYVEDRQEDVKASVPDGDDPETISRERAEELVEEKTS